jgi:site-specific recombinase XerD
MADQGLILKTVGLALNKFVIPDLIIVAELPESECNRFSRFFNTAKKDISRSKEEYDAAAKQLADIHKNQKYSSFIRKSDSQATRDFRVFMDANLLAYSNDLALEWLEFQRAKWSRAKYLTFRRLLLSINEILCTGTLSTSCFSTHEPKYSLPGWGDDLLSQYLREREREGCAVSTLDMIHSSCSRFIVFLDNHGIVSEKGITPEGIKDFQVQDNHSTSAGKNAYAIKIRGFLRFLARKGLVPETIELVVSTKMAPHTSIVTTLSDNQIDAIYAFRQNAIRPIELRNAAIILLGLRMGLRASDIANLKMTDISWKESSISFIQQKTGVHLKLPLPVDVGNSLYRYISEGRPQSNFHHVFVHHRAPYCRLGSKTFGRLLKTAVSDHCESEAIHGFHVTRKTFASKLLATGNPVTTIAAALGHVGVDAVDEYLATNEDQMRLCAIGLKGIEYSGGFSL